MIERRYLNRQIPGRPSNSDTNSDRGRAAAFSLVLEIQIRQARAVQQHDLPLGLAEEAEDTFAVEL